MPPEVNRILFVRNLPYKISPDELYEIFGKFGKLRQIRKGVSTKTKGSAFVVYEDIYSAKQAVDKLNGFNVAGKYLICLYFQQAKAGQKRGEDQAKVKEGLSYLKEMYK